MLGQLERESAVTVCVESIIRWLPGTRALIGWAIFVFLLQNRNPDRVDHPRGSSAEVTSRLAQRYDDFEIVLRKRPVLILCSRSLFTRASVFSLRCPSRSISCMGVQYVSIQPR
jgi:hypothetical protein